MATALTRGTFAHLVGLICAACSAPATLRELQVAQTAERNGQHDQAVAAYRAAQVTCQQLHPKRRRDIACVQAALGEAELLDQDGKRDAAIAAYQKILAMPAANNPGAAAEVAPVGEPDAAMWARAGYRVGALLLERGDATAAYDAWWRVITVLPNEPTAGDVVATLVRDARVRNVEQLAVQLTELLTSLSETDIADNILWALADIAEHERHDPTLARSHYDRIYLDHPTSGMRDDARWHAARLSRQLGDGTGAATRLRGLLRTREVAFGTGSYFSVWLDNAQLELGRVLRDDLHQGVNAADAFAQLLDDYPASPLRDDALFEVAITLHNNADRNLRRRGCAAWARLQREFPDSKHLKRAAEVGPCP
ncbi:MAG: tetratricopeptide repeat protein [Kofleriaceae bacterium]|nr:tetratricopeptide repeat protein [Kofleriaceae bacterium]